MAAPAFKLVGLGKDAMLSPALDAFAAACGPASRRASWGQEASHSIFEEDKVLGSLAEQDPAQAAEYRYAVDSLLGLAQWTTVFDQAARQAAALIRREPGARLLLQVDPDGRVQTFVDPAPEVEALNGMMMPDAQLLVRVAGGEVQVAEDEEADHARAELDEEGLPEADEADAAMELQVLVNPGVAVVAQNLLLLYEVVELPPAAAEEQAEAAEQPQTA